MPRLLSRQETLVYIIANRKAREVIPGEQDGYIMVQRVSIPLDIDGFLPLAEISQGIVRMVGNFQILLEKGTPGSHN